MTYLLLLGCLIISVPTFFFPGLYKVLGGFAITYPWQRVTSAFEHGASRPWLALHLVGNMILLVFAGHVSERILGAARFLTLTVLALVLYVFTQHVAGFAVNGSSVFIWSYGPFLAVVLYREWRDRGAQAFLQPDFERGAVALGIMWVVVTLLMPVTVYASGWKGNPLAALVLGNTFHISGTVAGIIGVMVWRKRIPRSVSEAVRGAAHRSHGAPDRWAVGIAALIPIVLLGFLVLAAVGPQPYDGSP